MRVKINILRPACSGIFSISSAYCDFSVVDPQGLILAAPSAAKSDKGGVLGHRAWVDAGSGRRHPRGREPRCRNRPIRQPNSEEQKRDVILSYVIGYGLALALTGAAFPTCSGRRLHQPRTLAIVLGLALVQTMVHFRFFFAISYFAGGARDDLQLILFSALIVVLMVWEHVILFNLRASIR